jgi:hypothetical protein
MDSLNTCPICKGEVKAVYLPSYGYLPKGVKPCESCGGTGRKKGKTNDKNTGNSVFGTNANGHDSK